jgi:hypothetical protein
MQIKENIRSFTLTIPDDERCYLINEIDFIQDCEKKYPNLFELKKLLTAVR